MGKKMLGLLVNNLVFKLMALGCAFILWLFVCNIDDPVKTKNFTCSVTIENADKLVEMSKYYEITNGTSVTFAASAQQSVLEKISDYDFVAVADMSRVMINNDMQSATVPIDIKCSRYTNSVKISDQTKSLMLSLDDMVTRRFMISANPKGTVAEGYALGEVSVSAPNVLRVSGPASDVNRIASVVATINVEGMNIDIRDTVMPELYDSNERKIDMTKMTLSSDTISISARILNTKEVPVNFQTYGAPAEPYTVVSISSDIKTVWIKGSSAVLNPITAINVPEGVLNVTGATADINSTIDIGEYLPNGAELLDSKDALANVTISIEPYRTREYMVKTGNIKINGIPDRMKATISRPSIGVMIGGMESDLAKLSADEITGNVVLDGLQEGIHSVALVLDLDSELYKPKRTFVDVVITRIEEEPPATGAGTGGTLPGETVEPEIPAEETNTPEAPEENQ